MRVSISRTLLLLFLALSAPVLIAQEAGVLFISSRPLGAAVFMNETAVAGTTPVLIRDLDPGNYRIELIKEGYLATRAELAFEGGEPAAVSYRLERDGIALDPEADSVSLNGVPVPGGESAIILDPGSYRLDYNDETLNFTPIYPQNGAIQALDILAPSVLLLGGLLMSEEFFLEYDENLTVSPVSVGLATLGAALGIADIRLRVDRREYLQSAQIRPARSEGDAAGEKLLAEAEEILSSGATAQAASRYAEFVLAYPESHRLPEVLYSLGRLHLIEGRLDLAASEFRLILERYPAAEVFDKSCKALADYYVLNGEYQAAANVLDSIVYYDPAFTQAEISDLAAAYRKQGATE